MTVENAKLILSREVKRVWPHGAPFPDYWKKQAAWLAFHAPHIGEKLVRQFVADMIETAQESLRADHTPKPYVVPENVREIWRKAEADGLVVPEVSHKISRSVPMKQGRLL